MYKHCLQLFKNPHTRPSLTLGALLLASGYIIIGVSPSYAEDTLSSGIIVGSPFLASPNNPIFTNPSTGDTLYRPPVYVPPNHLEPSTKIYRAAPETPTQAIELPYRNNTTTYQYFNLEQHQHTQKQLPHAQDSILQREGIKPLGKKHKKAKPVRDTKTD